MDDVVTREAARASAGGLELTCVGVRDETPSVKTFTFRVAAPEGFAHEAGQAMTLALPLDGEVLYRTFSVSSAPRPDGVIEMTIKAHPGGRVTPWLHRSLRPGATIAARRPRGRFTLARRSGDTLAFVSGGSGATPLMAMLRHLALTEPDADVAWFHAARDADEVLFAGELPSLQERMPNLRVAVTVSRPGPGWFGFRGRLSRRLIAVAVPDLGRREVFCCGPAPFMDEARLIHRAEGGRPQAFHTEAFGPAGPLAPLPAGDAAGASEPAYALRVGERILQVKTDETILHAALRQGVVIPCGCGQGLCGTCRITHVSGRIEMQHQGGLAPDEERSGYILACSTRLRSDGEIRV